jgi:hypothetical protein
MSHPSGRQPIGVNQPPYDSANYPFVAPSTDIARLLADFYLTYLDPTASFTLPLQVAWLYGFGDTVVSPPGGFPTPAHDYDLVVTDALGATVFDSTTASGYETTDWGDRLRIIQWRGADAICRVVLHTEWSPDMTPQAYDEYITPESGELDARTYERWPEYLQALRVNEELFDGVVRLVAGYNTTLEVERVVDAEGSATVWRVTMATAPGAGTGKYPGCPEEVEPVVRRINGIGPDASGNLRLDANDCLRWQRQARVWTDGGQRYAAYQATDLSDAEAAAVLRLYDDCTPCCPCGAFVNTYRGLSNVWDRWADVAATLETTRDDYAAGREQWLDAVACAAASSTRLVAVSNGACRVFLGGSFCNTTECCLSDVELRLTLQLYDADGNLAADPSGVEYTAAYLYTLQTGDQPIVPEVTDSGTGWPVYSFFVDGVPAGDSVTIKIILDVPCNAGQAVTATLTVHTPDIDGCDLTEIEMGDDLTTIWSDLGLTTDPVRGSDSNSVNLSP